MLCLRINKEITKEFENCNWFSNCGKRQMIEDVSLLYVDKNCDIEKLFLSQNYETAIYEAQGDLSSFLFIHHREEFREWNKLVEQVKIKVFPLILPNIVDSITSNNLPDTILPYVQYNLLMIIMASCYSQFYKSYFFMGLERIYLSGHLPCGWEGDYPQGSFMVL